MKPLRYSRSSSNASQRAGGGGQSLGDIYVTITNTIPLLVSIDNVNIFGITVAIEKYNRYTD